MCGFIAQLVEHRTGIAKVAGSNPVETQQLSVKSVLGALGAICNISSDDGEDLFADELFVY